MNKKIIIPIIILIIIFLIGLFAYINSKSTSGYIKISPQEAKEIMDNEDDIIILDVRTLEEYNSGYIQGAICIPNEVINSEAENQLTDKNKQILVYCRSGNRSRQASEALIEMGYKNVKDFGGIIDWPYEIVY